MMKRCRIVYSILIILVAVLCCPVSKINGRATEKEWTYSETEGGICITAYNGEDKEIVIPSIIDEKQVVAIGGHVFDENETITQVIIPESVTDIGRYAFYGCVNLEKVELKEGLKTIGGDTFSRCVRLKEIRIPKSVEEIDCGSFYRCSNLDKIVVEEGNAVYDSRDNCNAIIETASNKLIRGGGLTVIPDSVTSIGYYAFCGCSNLNKIDIPDSVTEIEWEAFNGCRNLTEIKLPSKIKTISNGMFYECYKLSSIQIPDGVENISDKAFKFCGGMNEIKIPDSVTSIGKAAFSGCSILETIELSSNITSIESLQFEYCTKLKSIEIPNGVTNIGHRAFQYCKSLETITFPDSINEIGNDIFAYANDNITVRCYRNSVVDKYAKENGLNVIYLGDSKQNNTDTSEKNQDKKQDKNELRDDVNSSKEDVRKMEVDVDPKPDKGATIKKNSFEKSENDVGKLITVGSITYKIIKVTDDGVGEVEFSQISPKRKGKIKLITIPATIVNNGRSYKVTCISNKALSNCKRLKRMVIKSKLLTQKSFSCKAFKKLGKNVIISVPKSSKKRYKKWLAKTGFKGKVR